MPPRAAFGHRRGSREGGSVSETPKRRTSRRRGRPVLNPGSAPLPTSATPVGCSEGRWRSSVRTPSGSREGSATPRSKTSLASTSPDSTSAMAPFTSSRLLSSCTTLVLPIACSSKTSCEVHPGAHDGAGDVDAAQNRLEDRQPHLVVLGEPHERERAPALEGAEALLEGPGRDGRGYDRVGPAQRLRISSMGSRSRAFTT